MNNPDIANLHSAITSHRICVLIPTYNNAGTLRCIVSDVLKYCPNVIVVNDGSTDSTSQILESFGNKIDVVSYAGNCGKGTALKRGFSHARSKGFEYAITIDSDGQHYADDIPLFVKAIIENPQSLIVGERDLSNVDINGKSSFANKFSNFWFALQTGRRLLDTQTGYRAYPLNKLYGLSILTGRYEAELELLVFASWNGVNIKSIPIKVYYPPQAERVSHFKPALDFTRISILNTILCVAAIVYGIPARIINSISQKRIFNFEFKPFTRKNGEQKEAATTLGRLVRSIYGLAFFVFWSIGVFTPIALIFFAFGKASEKRKLRFHKMLQWISDFLNRRYPGANVVYENPTNEDFSKPALIICNHQSHLDLPVMMATYPKLIFLTNDWVWNNPFFGKIIHRAEYLPVSAGMDVIMPHLRDLRDRGYSIVVFPEGTRSADCSILRFHQGAFLLAKELEMDIVPMTIHGAGHYLPKKDFMFRKATITLRIMERVPFNTNESATLLKRASRYRKLIKQEYDDIARRVETAEYFRSLVLYKYAYRGWWIVAECKQVLKQLPRIARYIDNQPEDIKTVRIVNSGTGVFALLYALVNKHTEVYSFEENLKKFEVAENTAALPKNLHPIHPVWPSDYSIPGIIFDKTIVLNCPNMAGIDYNKMFDSSSIVEVTI